MIEKIIGIDYSDENINDFIEVEITVVEGVKPVLYNRLFIRELKDILTLVLALSLKYGAKVNFENNRHRLYSLFRECGCFDLLRINTIAINSGDFNKFYKHRNIGVTYTRILQDLFYKCSDFLEHNKDFENSYRIAVLPILFSPDFQNKIEEIKRLENNLKELKESL